LLHEAQKKADVVEEEEHRIMLVKTKETLARMQERKSNE
jgi:hypothetical protein